MRDDEAFESPFESPFLAPSLEAEAALVDHESPGRPAPIAVIDDHGNPLAGGDYVAQQGNTIHMGSLDAKGLADLSPIDLGQPFVFGLKDRVCAIQDGAFFDPDDAQLQYGGTWFDWTLVRDDRKAEQNFWPYYHQEMANPGARTRTVDRFWQHEHITRRPIQATKSFLATRRPVQLRAVPPQIRVGPFLRYTDHQSAVVFLETVTPCLALARFRKDGTTQESVCATATVRVGGRHFAFLELTGLAEDTFHQYTVRLAPLPAAGPIPVKSADVQKVFPSLSKAVEDAIQVQMKDVSFFKTEWLMFRTLRRTYDTQLRFATGSCRWYPGDKKTADGQTKDWGPDMLDGLGNWLQGTAPAEWPHFLFFNGDQIYADEIGDDHGNKLVQSRFAARIPGPTDASASMRDKLVDGAWSGRFAHRYKAYRPPSQSFQTQVDATLKKADQLYQDHPDIRQIMKTYPESDPDKKLREIYETLKGRREINGAKTPADDERAMAEAVNALIKVKALESTAERFRGARPHWAAASDAARKHNPMRYAHLSQNFLLWTLPEFEHQAPSVQPADDLAIPGKPNDRGRAAVDGKHASDFAEYAYLYERAWTSSRNVRVLLGQVPTFLMFDDHELTDDWNFDLTWVRLLHNPKDGYRMWPKTLTDALASYFVYQGYGNKAPGQWDANDPRVRALTDAQRDGSDALPRLRLCINKECFPEPDPKASRKDPQVSFQAGLKLDWHYQLPFNPPFLVPDCRSRKRLVQGDDSIRAIDHDAKNKPLSQTIDNAQVSWIQNTLGAWRGGPIVFIGASVPFLLHKKPMDFMLRPETIASVWARGKAVLPLLAGVFNSTTLGLASEALLRVFRRGKDLEHPVRDKTWRDLWGILAGLKTTHSPVKTVVLLSGDVHHSYCMTAQLPGEGGPKPELLQITCSGLQTTIRSDTDTAVSEALGSSPFRVGKYTMTPGFVSKNGTGAPDLVLWNNAVALVRANVGGSGAPSVAVDFLVGKDKHMYRYTAGPAPVAPQGGFALPEGVRR